ncbi:hypothetical protein [Microcella alkalica]|uniref:DUF2530 domain-containing protein n=1 Tax=Microcella alkalica TaxID=355930 RepID=A0A839ECR3_9MICO|nr:hypothetical protein [Microcella alkalica]MBA8848034.1 hypothetical protein [Microcella alkalica]
MRSAERRPDPAPLRTDDRLAFTIGLIGWIIAGVITVGIIVLTDRDASVGSLITIGVGLLLGMAGWVVSSRRT